MKSVLKLAYICAKQLAISLNENHARKAVYYYGFYILFGSLIKAIFLIFLSLILGILKPVLIIVVVFGSLRMLAGGFHFDTFDRCLFISLALFVSAALLAKYTYNYLNLVSVIMFLILTSVGSLYVLIKYAPKDTQKKPLTDPVEIMKFKKLSILYLFLLLTFSSVLAFYKFHLYVLSICFGIVIEVFSVSPIGNTFFNKLKTALNEI